MIAAAARQFFFLDEVRLCLPRTRAPHLLSFSTERIHPMDFVNSACAHAVVAKNQLKNKLVRDFRAARAG